MDPITAAILAAIAAGAAAGLSDAAKTVIADAYTGLKSLVKNKLGDDNEVTQAIVAVEAKPESIGRKETLKEEVLNAKIDQDANLQAMAMALLEKVKATPAGTQIIQSVTGNNNYLVAGTGNSLTVNNYTPAPADEQKKNELAGQRQAYLESLFVSTDILPLGGISPELRGRASARYSLGAVYTALLTLSPKAAEHFERLVQPAPFDDDERRSNNLEPALAKLNIHPRLVLLGQPGGGKTSFVNFVAHCLCAEALGGNYLPSGLKLLITPLAPDEDSALALAWTHGALLPVLVVLREFAASQFFPTSDQKGSSQHLIDFLTHKLQQESCAAFAAELPKELRQADQCVLMLDGLDEVPEANHKRQRLKDVIESFARNFSATRILVTSRQYAYRVGWELTDFEVAVLSPFTPPQINQFIDRWYAQVAANKILDANESLNRAQRLKDRLEATERLAEFASNPLLLTLMASLHVVRELPDRRAELYKDAVDLLLKRWEADKGLTDLLKISPEELRTRLNRLAYQTHAAQPVGQKVAADISRASLLNALDIDRRADPRDLIDYVQQRTGLLLSDNDEVYRFPHRTFQEYMAACYLAQDDNEGEFPAGIARRVRKDPERWREVALLVAGQVALGTDFPLWALVRELCPEAPPAEAGTLDDVQGSYLAGLALAELIDPAKVSRSNADALKWVQDWLVHSLKFNLLPAFDRVQVGNTLAAIGDPRFDATRYYLPNKDEDILGFVRIPAGPFLLGTRQADIPKLMEQFGGKENHYIGETEQHTVDLPDFYMARYPVTVAQFREFAQTTDKLSEYERALQSPANHPVTSVTWHAAIAYCRWLTDTLRNRADTPEPLKTLLTKEQWTITLPSEAEWEKAARGPSAGSGDGRLFAWGDDYDPDKANVGDTKIGGPSPVGCFAMGATPEGLQDLTGNVWEWTRSHYKGYPYVDKIEREDLKAGDNVSRGMRGGSYDFGARLARCAYRLAGYPDDRYSGSGFRVGVVPFRP